jgi:hypothetical protein
MSDVLDRILRQRQGKAGIMILPSDDPAAPIVGEGHPNAPKSPQVASSVLSPNGGAEFDDSEVADNFGAFGWLRGAKERAVMLELRKKTGAILAVGYSWIEFIEYEPSDGITLWIPGRKVRLQGRNLNAPASADRPHVRLFEGLTRHRVPWVAVQEGLVGELAHDKKVTIERIDW